MSLQNTDSLLDICLYAAVLHLDELIDSVADLPASMKCRLLHLMMKRDLVTDANIGKVLTNKVRHLDLGECSITDRSLQLVAETCPQLVKLDLNTARNDQNDISSLGLIALFRGCRNLQVVYLRRCIEVNDATVTELARNCPRLRELNVGGCTRITDESLRALGENCPQLSSINFSKANVTDAGVLSLARGVCSASLTEVHMDGCSGLTDESVEALVQFCPNLSILRFQGCINITERSREALVDLMAERSRMSYITWTVY